MVLFFAAWISQIRINANVDAFLEEETESVTTYYETRSQWGTDEFTSLCVTAGDWFTEAGVERIKEIEADLQAVDYVASTMSILDVPLLRQQPGEKPNFLLFFRLAKRLDARDTDLELARQEHADHEITRGNLISDDGRTLNVLAFLDWSQMKGKPRSEVNMRRTKLVHGVRRVAEKWEQRLSEPVRLSGVPYIQITMFENLRHDLVVFGAASLLLFTTAFLVVYRRPRFVIIPIVCCLLPPVTILGAMALLGIPVGFVTSNMPVLLFVLVLPYTVYFIERYRERRRRRPDEDGLSSTMGALGAIAVPCLFSATTTMAGFVALGTSRIIPIRDFGQTMAVGIALGFITVFFVIALASRRLTGLTVAGAGGGTNRRSGWIIRLFEHVSLTYPGWVLVASAAILFTAVIGASRISAESKFTSYFWRGSDVYQGLEYIDQKMGGTTWIEIILTSKKKGYFATERGLQALEVVQSYFGQVDETGNIFSLISLRDEVRKTFRPDWFPWVADGTLLRSVDLLAPELVKQAAGGDFTTSRVTVRMQETAPSLNREAILTGLHEHLAKHAEAELADIDVQITGVFPVYAELLELLIGSQRRSVLFVAGAVYAMLLILFRSPLLALLVLIPQALPVTVVLGVIGFCGIPLDLVTSMIGSIAIGVGIDAAIQYTMRFRSEHEATGDHRLALSRAHATIGRAIWIATTIIISGFAILLLSDFFPLVWFGFFTSLAMLISQLATLTVLPSLFLLTGYPRKRRRGASAA